MAKHKKPTVEELEDQLEGLRTILEHVAPGVDLRAEMDNIAFRRDGTAVYIGDLEAGATSSSEEADGDSDGVEDQDREPEASDEDDEEYVEENVRRLPHRRRITRRPALSRTRHDATPNLDKMSVEERAKFYTDVMLKDHG